MTTRYRVEYALKSHRRDEFIEWIKGLLSVPFVLHAGSIGVTENDLDSSVSAEARRRYAEIFSDLETLINQHIALGGEGSRLRQLVPSVGQFFTPLPLEQAFLIQDKLRSISQRRLVSPSFNDVRQILNTAQAISLAQDPYKAQLVTFDGDVTLYEDGSSLFDNNPIIESLLRLLKHDVYVGIVTAAGYADKSGSRYAQRLEGLIHKVMSSTLTLEQKNRFVIMGGESNYLFRLNGADGTLKWIDPELWQLPEVAAWSIEDIENVLDTASQVLATAIKRMNLQATLLRKERGVGVVPMPGQKISREQLEEVVLCAQRTLENSEAAQRISFCAFNGGNDVWVDIGDKKLGVLSLQKYLGGIPGSRTLHVGDQFASVGANDFKARMAACTVWIANPRETVRIMDEFANYMCGTS